MKRHRCAMQEVNFIQTNQQEPRMERIAYPVRYVATQPNQIAQKWLLEKMMLLYRKQDQVEEPFF